MTDLTPVVHQMVATGVACGVPPYHFKTNPPPPEPHDGTGGYDFGNRTHNGRVTCPECLKVPVKISRGGGSAMVVLHPRRADR